MQDNKIWLVRYFYIAIHTATLLFVQAVLYCCNSDDGFKERNTQLQTKICSTSIWMFACTMACWLCDNPTNPQVQIPTIHT